VPNGVSQLLAVRAVGADAWAVGTAGSAGVVITSQGGGAWQTQTTPATLGLDGVAFADQSNGWATGLDTAGGPIVLQTTDGGAVWTQTAATPAVTTPSAVATVAGAGAWVIGGGSCSANAVVAQSSDGGGSWQTELAMVDTQAQYRRPAFHSGFGAMIVKTCEYRVVLSADIARFWTPAAVFPTAFQSLALAMPDRNHLWVVGSNQSGPVIYASKDGGTSWRLQQTPAGFVQPDHVAFGTNNNGWSLGQDQGSNSAVIGTSDGGRHWTTDPIPAGVSLTAIAAIGSSDVWAVGSNTSGGAAVIASVDGGMTWGMQTLPAGLGALQDASFVDALHGWAAGQDTAGNGAVASTSDGGATWQQLTVPTSDPFNSVSFASDSIGWVLGPSGVLWTTDGGATWAARRHSIICPFPEQLAAISTHTLAMVGAKVGGAPVIVRSTTSAFNWDAMTVFDPTWVDESPVTGAPGSTANLSGHGFDPGELVSVRWGSVTGSPLATVTADSSGSFSISFTVPSSATAARYRVYAVGKVSLATPFHNFEVT